VSRTAPTGAELADAANALVITVMLSFQDRNETLSPFSDSCLMTHEFPEKYKEVRFQINRSLRYTVMGELLVCIL
jgi:hypothetical protein